MSIKPVDLKKAYRLLQVGPTTMISAKHDGIENVMAAAWVSLVGNNKIMAYIGKQAFTRELVEKNGYYVVQIPTVKQMETVLFVGEHSSNIMKNKLKNIPLFYKEGFDLPLVVGAAGWIICKIIPNKQNQEEHDLFMGEIVGAWSDDRVFKDGHWIFDEAPEDLHTVHYVAGGQFYQIGKGTKFNHGPGKD